MSLRCLAILGSKNEPLYICAAGPTEDENDQNTDNDNDESAASQEPEDIFGFFGDDDNNNNNDDEDGDDDKDFEQTAEKSGYMKRPASIRHEMMIHSAIDRIEELLGSHRKITWKRFQRGSHWIGQICPMEEYDIYGYVTTSDVKILALLDRDGIVPIKKRKEVDIKIMFTAIHDCYVKYTLNPFSKIRAKIQPPCTEFETSLQSAMDQYNNAVSGN